MTIVIVFLLNFLLSTLPVRLDFSQGKIYTLSPATKKVLSSLQKPIAITFFASSNLPARLLPLKTDVVDILNEYSEMKGKVSVSVVDPSKNENALKQVKEAGIPELQFSQMDQNKYAVTASYFGLLIAYGDKKEALPQVTDLSTLEYNLTSTIYRLTKTSLDKVAVIGPMADLQIVGQVLSSQFEVDPITLSDKEDFTIPASNKALVLVETPEQMLTGNETAAVKKYLQASGRAMLFVDGVGIDSNFVASNSASDLLGLVKDYGIAVDKNLVLSANAELVSFSSSQGSFFVPYPFWFKTNGFNSQSSYFNGVRQLTFPFSSSLTLNNNGDYETKPLVMTIKQSWTQKDQYVLDPQLQQTPKSSDFKTLVVAAESKSKSGQGQLIVVPSSRFPLDRYQNQTSDNLGFLLNSLNEMASGGALTGIRARMTNYYPLPELADSQKDLFKYSAILLLPLLFGGYGFIRLWKRR